MANNVAEKLNPYLSNLVVLYAKFHDLHWFVKGSNFVQVHLYTETRYDDLAMKFDEVAEKIIMKGEKPVSTLKEYLALATVEELGKKENTDSEVLAEVLKDTETLCKQATDIRAAFEEAGEFSILPMLEDHIVGYEKEIWFLQSMVK